MPAPTSLAPYVANLGRGPGKSRALSMVEAQEAMTLILQGKAEPEAVGAFLMLLRYRGESPAEIAGMVLAMRARAADWRALVPTLDWPSYAAGRTRGLPWFLLSAKLVAATGATVVLHGWNSHQDAIAAVRPALGALNIPLVNSAPAAKAALYSHGIAYAPLESIDAALLKILRLREILGLRSPINTCLRAYNPGGAGTSVQGVFHPPYRGLQQESAAVLGETDMLVVKGGGGEFERHPAKETALFGLRAGVEVDETAPALLDETRRLADMAADPAQLTALWAGTHADAFAETTVTGTAALALLALRKATTLTECDVLAQSLWQSRNRSLT